MAARDAGEARAKAERKTAEMAKQLADVQAAAAATAAGAVEDGRQRDAGSGERGGGTCRYSGPRGSCSRPARFGQFCDLHACPTPGCCNSKSSRQSDCGRGCVAATPAAPPASASAAASLDHAKLTVQLATQLGESGGSADVFRGTFGFVRGQPPDTVAVKVFRGTKSVGTAALGQIMLEVDIGKRIGAHPNLVSTYGHTLKPSVGICIVMELMGGGSLHAALSKQAAAFPALGTRLGWLADVASAMEWLHGMKPPITHNDLKALNVLLTASGVAKVADFGLAKVTTKMQTTLGVSTSSKGSMAGTLGYKAPETYTRRSSTASDVFGYAMIIYYVATGMPPFEGETEQGILGKIQAKFEYDEELDEEDGVSEEKQQKRWLRKHPLSSRRPSIARVRDDSPQQLVDLMERCWADSGKDRPHFMDIVAVIQQVRSAMAAAPAAAPAATLQKLDKLEVMMEALMSGQNRMQSNQRQVLDRQEEMINITHALQKDMVVTLDAIDRNRASITAALNLLIAAQDEKVPWLFVVVPDARGKRVLTSPKKWGKRQYNIHLVCNGRRDKGIGPHFLFETLDELQGPKRGYTLLEPRKALKKFGPLIKFMLGAFCLAAKGVAVAFLPHLAGLVPGLQTLFAEEDGVLGESAADAVTEQFDSVCAAMTGLVDGDDVDPGSWQCPPAADVYKPAQQDFAEFLLAQDKAKGHRFFGLKYYPNTVAGAGDGTGTPLWLCPKCYAGLSAHGH